MLRVFKCSCAFDSPHHRLMGLCVMLLLVVNRLGQHVRGGLVVVVVVMLAVLLLNHYSLCRVLV